MVKMDDIAMVASLLRMLETFIAAPEGKFIMIKQEYLESVFVFCAVWAFGAGLVSADDATGGNATGTSEAFSDWWKSEFRTVRFPSTLTVFDWWLDCKAGFVFSDFEKTPMMFQAKELVTPFTSTEHCAAEVVVPTSINTARLFWMGHLLRAEYPVLVAGAANVGKRSLVRSALHSLQQGAWAVNDGVHVVEHTVTATCQPDALSALLKAPLRKKGAQTFGPPADTSRVIYFIDDLAMGSVDGVGVGGGGGGGGGGSQAAVLRHLIANQRLYVHSGNGKAVEGASHICTWSVRGASSVDSEELRLRRLYSTMIAVESPTSASVNTIVSHYLNGHLQTHAFTRQQRNGAAALAKGIATTHLAVAREFKASPHKPHYVYGLSNVLRMFDAGLLKTLPESTVDLERLVLVWLHEASREYGDPMTEEHDVERLGETLRKQAVLAFPGINVQKFFAVPPATEAAEPLVFSTLADRLDDPENEAPRFTMIPVSLEAVREPLEAALERYNVPETPRLQFSTFDAAIHSLCHLMRSLSIGAGGFVSLVGPVASGRRATVRLAGFLLGFANVYTTTRSTFTEDLHAAVLLAGCEGEALIWLVSDDEEQGLSPADLSQLTALARGDDPPGLLSKDDVSRVLVQLEEPTIAELGGPENRPKSELAVKSAVWAYFLRQLRRKLHGVVIFDASSPTFASRRREYPHLFQVAHVEWLRGFPPESAEVALVKSTLAKEVPSLGSAMERNAVERFVSMAISTTIEVDPSVHVCRLRAARSFVRIYATVLDQRRGDCDELVDKYSAGVQIMLTAKEDARRLRTEVTEMQLDAQEKKVAYERAEKALEEERETVLDKEAKVAAFAEHVQKLWDDVEVKQADVEFEFNKAIPHINTAEATLEGVERSDIGDLKNLLKLPDESVEDVFSALVVLMVGLNDAIQTDEKGNVSDYDRSWPQVKASLLSNVNGFIESLANFKGWVDTGDVPAENMKKIRAYLILPHFTPEHVKEHSDIGGSLCLWMQSMVQYYDIIQIVEPKRAALHKARTRWELDTARLEEERVKLAAMEAHLEKVRRATERTKQVWKAAVKTAERGVLRLELATKLVNDLVEEAEKWDKQTDKWRDVRELLVGDVLVASAMAVLAAPLHERERDLLLEQWQTFLQTAVGGKPLTVSPQPLYSLSVVPQAQRLTWPMHGVEPEDRHANYSATATGMLLLDSCPLLVDPQGVGLAWLRDRFSDDERQFKEVDASSPDLAALLRKAALKGLTVVVLMHDVAELAPGAVEALMPFLAKSVVYNEVEEEAAEGADGKEGKVSPEKAGKAEAKQDSGAGTGTETKGDDGGGSANPQGPDNVEAGGEGGGATEAVDDGVVEAVAGEAKEEEEEQEEEEKKEEVAPPVAQFQPPVPRKPFLVLPKEQIPYDPAYRLIIHTSARTPSFSPRVLSVASVVNWSPSSEDLQAKALTTLFRQEHPKLQVSYSALRSKTVHVTFDLYAVELSLLTELTTGDTSNVTEDRQVIEDVGEKKHVAAGFVEELGEQRGTW